MSMIEFRQATKRFDDHVVLYPLNLDIESGEVAVIIGPSGSGKSTMLRCINVLETISDGDLRVDSISVLGSSRDVRRIRLEAGMVFQHFNLFPNLTAMQNVMFGPIRARGRAKAEAREIAAALLQKVGLADMRVSLDFEETYEGYGQVFFPTGRRQQRYEARQSHPFRHPRQHDLEI
jgi:glutamine transport system ATP-binding protein